MKTELVARGATAAAVLSRARRPGASGLAIPHPLNRGVQDPDGYLVRPQETLGSRPVQA